ncbi:MAG: hypothetical protein LCH46_13055 [Proteobacteria bacterium]|nr:hypothetical protein [Pseudomonadota bacterium]
MKKAGLANPLGAGQAAVRLTQELKDLGLEALASPDMAEFDAVKRKCRGIPVAPMHHHETGVFDGHRAYWMSLKDSEGNTVGLQAFRFDVIDTHLADWCINYMIGVYMRRQELMVPTHAHPPAGNVAERLTGRLVYHGEIWVDKGIRNRRVFECFVRLGLILSLIKWQPDAIWGLASSQMAGHGHFTRVGYTILERGFLRWQWASEGIDPVEYLVAVERDSLEAMVEEMLATEALCPPAQSQKSLLPARSH